VVQHLVAIRLQVHGRNNRLSRWGMQGVFATDDARAPRDVRGHTLPVRFEIVDKRPLPPAQGAVHGDTAQAQRRGPYTVAVSLQVRASNTTFLCFLCALPRRGCRGRYARYSCSVLPATSASAAKHSSMCMTLLHGLVASLGVVGAVSQMLVEPAPSCWHATPTDMRLPCLQGVGLDAMNSGPQPVVGMTDIYHEPGVYVLEIPCPRTRSTATVHIEMSDEHKLAFVDEFSLSFHMHYYRLLKWLVAVPFTAAALAVLALQVGGFNDQLPTLGSLRQD